MGLLVVALAGLGVFSVTAGAVASRRREIGIRSALGASQGRTLRLLLAQASVPLVAGIVTGLTIAFSTNRLVSHFLYDTAPADLFTMAGVGFGVMGMGWLAAYVPARRALQVDPTVALRQE